jgi:signal transduction histidine kinase
VQIRTRLTLQFTILVSTIVLMAFMSIYYFTAQFSEREFYRRLKEKAITSAILLIKVEGVDSALLQVIDRAKRDNLYKETIRIYDYENKEIYFSGDTTKFLDPESFNYVRRAGELRIEKNNFDVIGVLFRDKGFDYVVVAAAVDINGEVRLKDLQALLTFAFLILTAVVFISGWIYSGRALKPLKRIMDEVKRISPQNLDQRLKESPYEDEMGKLILIFNELLGRIAKAFQLQKMFVSNVSHELKNPLTNITSQLEVTLLKERSTEEYRETIESVLEDIRGLNQLSNSLLELARLTREQDSFTMTRVRLDEIIWDVRDFVSTIDSTYRVEVSIHEMPEDENKLTVLGNPYLLKIAFQNIVENACKFAPDKSAKVTLTLVKNELIVEVSDQGPGIEKKDLNNVFEPFFRTDATSKIKGYGIGLPLSHRILSIHKGRIELDSSPGKGTIVRVALAALK